MVLEKRVHRALPAKRLVGSFGVVAPLPPQQRQGPRLHRPLLLVELPVVRAVRDSSNRQRRTMDPGDPSLLRLTDESRLPPAEGVQVTETDGGFRIAWESREEQGTGVRVARSEWLVDTEISLVQRKTTEIRIVTGGETIRARTQYDYSGFNEGIVVTPPAELHEVSESHPEAIFWPYGAPVGGCDFTRDQLSWGRVL